MSQATQTGSTRVEVNQAMLKIERILCPTDFSDFSAKAFDYAVSLARHYGSRVFLQHVIQPVTYAYPYYAFPDSVSELYWNLSEHAQEQLRNLVKSHSPNGIQSEIVVHTGPVPESILSFAEKNAADLIVMGTHGRRGLDRMTMGSVTETVLRKAKCPVLAVRSPLHDFVTGDKGRDSVQLRKLLFCTDFSEHSARALSYAFSLAMEYNAELTLLNVLEDIEDAAMLRDSTAETIRELEKSIPADARNWCAVKTSVRVGKPYQEIIQLALESQSDLIIMGVRGRSPLDLALFGSTTQRVIQLGPCPVLAVHT
jgi:nucleotide-binding universal stress UspA family protein